VSRKPSSTRKKISASFFLAMKFEKDYDNAFRINGEYFCIQFCAVALREFLSSDDTSLTLSCECSF